MNCIVSSISGRIRLRDPSLRESGRHEDMKRMLQTFDGMSSVEGNVRTGSFLLRYDPVRVGKAAMESRVLAAAAAVIPGPNPPAGSGTVWSGPERRRPLSRRLNTAAKVGMLGSLGTSLILAAAGKKHLHAAAGSVFTALLAIHLAVHRRHLLK
jgi:hypothetical protein